MKELILILALFKQEASDYGIQVPDSIKIEYGVLGIDTFGVATKGINGSWEIKISQIIEQDIVETIVYHELGHVMGLKDCSNCNTIMNYLYIVPLNESMKKRLFKQIISSNNL